MFPTREQIHDVDVSNTHANTDGTLVHNASPPSSRAQLPTHLESASSGSQPQSSSPRSSRTLPFSPTSAPNVDDALRLIKQGGPFKLPPRKGTLVLGAGVGALVGRFESASSGGGSGSTVRSGTPSSVVSTLTSVSSAPPDIPSPSTGTSSTPADQNVEVLEPCINASPGIAQTSPRSMVSPSIQSTSDLQIASQSDPPPSQPPPRTPTAVPTHVRTFGAPPSPPPSPHPNHPGHARSGANGAGSRKSVLGLGSISTGEEKEKERDRDRDRDREILEKQKQKQQTPDDKDVLNVIGAVVDAAIGVANAVEAGASSSSRSPSIVGGSISSPSIGPLSVSPSVKPGSVGPSPSLSYSPLPSFNGVSPALSPVSPSVNPSSISPMSLKQELPAISIPIHAPTHEDLNKHVVPVPTLPSRSPSVPSISILPQQPILVNYVQTQVSLFLSPLSLYILEVDVWFIRLFRMLRSSLNR